MAKQRTQKTEFHRFYCTQCGNEGIPILRNAGQKRETAHLKALYCPSCAKITNHCEISTTGIYQYEDFIKDFEKGKWSK